MSRRPGVRARLLVVVVVAVAPVVVLLVVQASAARRDEVDRARQEALRVARLLADAEEETAAELATLLRTLATSADHHGRAAVCDALPEVLDTQPRVAQLGLVARDGGTACGELPAGADGLEPLDVEPGRERRSHLGGAQPALAVVAGGRTVVAVATSLLSLEDAMARSGVPPGSTITMFDAGGRIFARVPDDGFVGRVIAGRPLPQADAREGRDSTFEVDGLDGRRRLYGHARIRGATPLLTVVVGIPTTAAYERADADLRRGLATVAATTAAAVVVTLLLAEATVAKPLRGIAEVARRMAAGALDARTGQVGGDEIGDVGVALDELAGAVVARNAQLDRIGRDREALLRELLEVQQAERRRLAEDIHDESIQELTAAALRVQRLRRLVADDGAAAAARDAEEAVGRAITDLRGLMGALVPDEEDAPLAAQLRRVLQDALDDGGVVWDLDVDLGGEPAPEVRSLVVRSVREAVTNVVRHAGASRVGVRAWQEPGVVAVEVEDDGSGFDPAAPVEDGRLGLRTIRRRTEGLGGFWRVVTAPGAGTTVTFGVPTDTPGPTAPPPR